jgi:hypothetical protein
MIRHIVLARFRADVCETARAQVFASLSALKAVVPGMIGFDAGANVSPEKLARGHNNAFVVDFVDGAARDAYLVHPAHKAAGAALVALTEGGVDGLIVLDFEIAD